MTEMIMKRTAIAKSILRSLFRRPLRLSDGTTEQDRDDLRHEYLSQMMCSDAYVGGYCAEPLMAIFPKDF